MKTISIAGSAGRKDDGYKLHAGLYASAQDAVTNLLATFREDGSQIHLVSGGAAYMDHLAVRIFLAGLADKLTLHLPCKWDRVHRRLEDTGEFNWAKNPGGTANALHRKFQKKTGVDSFGEMAKAIAHPNCTVTVSPGFHARNVLMAESDILIALTFGHGAKVKDGGTAHTCQTYLDRVRAAGAENLSWHIDLNKQPPQTWKGIEV